MTRRHVSIALFVALAILGVMAPAVFVLDLARSLPDFPAVPPGPRFHIEHADELASVAGIVRAHIVSAILFAIIGPLQFVTALRRKVPQLHRVAGRIFVGAAYVASVTGIALGALVPFGGGAETAVAVVAGTFVAVATTIAWRAAMARRIVVHQQWILRAWAAGLGVATMRAINSAGFSVQPFTHETWFALSLALGVALNVLVAEWFLRGARRGGG